MAPCERGRLSERPLSENTACMWQDSVSIWNSKVIWTAELKLYTDKVLLKFYIRVHLSFVEVVFCVLEHKVQTHIGPWLSDKVQAELGSSFLGHLMEVIVCVLKQKLQTHLS